jgi:Cu/Zn superoxide dismutase
MALSILVFNAGCNDEEMNPGDGLPELTGKSVTYNLVTTNNSELSGNIVFAETTAGTTLITFTVSGGTPGGMHPAHIHENSVITGGGIKISLGEINGSTGSLVIEVSESDDGSHLSYDALVAYDGHINIHESLENIANLVARADIGGNELTGQSEDFDLFGIMNLEVKGEATIYERKNGKTLVSIKLENDTTQESHPTHIHSNTAAEGGPIIISLNPVNEDTKISNTDITSLDDGTMISYSDLKNLDGYVNVHLSSDALSTLVVQGDFGQNKLTSDEESYDLLEISGSGVSGVVTFTKRRNDETLITIILEGTVQGNQHPSHIHQNSAVNGGPILIDLDDVNGDSGISKTQVTSLNDGTPLTYEDLINIDGHVNVHLSSENLGTVIAKGDVGANIQ